MRRLANFVGGQSVAPASGKYVGLISPVTGKPFAEMPVSNETDVDRAFQSAAKAFTGWKRSTPSERSMALLKIADLLEANAEELVAIESENTGKIISVTMSEEIPPMLDQIRFFAGAARNLEGRAAMEYMNGMTSLRAPRTSGGVRRGDAVELPHDDGGVEVGAGRSRRGNTMVLKPGDSTPASSLFMAELMAQVLPEGVFSVVCGDRDTDERSSNTPSRQWSLSRDPCAQAWRSRVPRRRT